MQVNSTQQEIALMDLIQEKETHTTEKLQQLPTELLISVLIHLPARELNRLQLLGRAIKREIHAKDYIWKVLASPITSSIEAVHSARPWLAQPIPDWAGLRLAKRYADQDGEFDREAYREAHV